MVDTIGVASYPGLQPMGEKSGMPGQCGDVMMTYPPPFLPWFVQMVADTSSLQHQIDRAFPIFLAHVEKQGKAWIRGYNRCMSLDRTNSITSVVTCDP